MLGVLSSARALLYPLRTVAVCSNELLFKISEKAIMRTGIVAGLVSPRSREQLGDPAQETIWDSILLWAVPKKRTSHSKKRMRMTHKYLKPKTNYQLCPKCGQFKLLHVLCGHCFRETMRLTAELRKRRTAETTQSAGNVSRQLRAHSRRETR